MIDEDDEIVLQFTDPQNCARCSGPGLLSAQFSYSWKNASGKEIPGTREAVLCPGCDHGQPAADGLLSFFEVHETLAASELETFHDLAVAWVAGARARQVDQQQLDDEHERFRTGEL